MNIILPGRSADPTRARTIVPAKAYDIEYEIERQRLASIPWWQSMQRAGIPLRPDHAPGSELRNSNQGNIWVEHLFSNKGDGPTVASVAAETALLNATTEQPWFYGGFFGNNFQSGKWVHMLAKGVMQTVATAPTFTFFVRLGTTANVITGGIIGQSAAITTAVTAAGNIWEMEFSILLTTPGIGNAAATITSGGTVQSPVGFVSPFIYALEPTTPPTATWTTTLDGSVSNFLMLSMNPGTSSASNTCTLKHCLVWSTTH